MVLKIGIIDTQKPVQHHFLITNKYIWYLAIIEYNIGFLFKGIARKQKIIEIKKRKEIIINV